MHTGNGHAMSEPLAYALAITVTFVINLPEPSAEPTVTRELRDDA